MEFYNRSMKLFLQNNDIKMYSEHNERKSAVSEKFTRTLKNKIYKTYIDSSKEINSKYPKFKISDIVRISKCENILAKGYTPNWSGIGYCHY